MAESIIIKAQCLCKTHTFCASLDKSALPLKAACCHCTSCRRLTGSLYSSCAEWPNPSEDLSSLNKYSFSRDIDIFYCGTCSAKLFCRVSNLGDGVFVVTGALENRPGLIHYNSHMFVGDTIDGGASVWLPRHESGEPVKRWKGLRGSEELPLDWPTPKAIPSLRLKARASPPVTTFHCHCSGVRLSLRSAADLEADPAKDSTSSCINPDTLKFRATLDSCDSCRLTLGSDVSTWAYAPLTHIGFSSGNDSTSKISEFPQTLAALKEAVTSPGHKDWRLGTLAVYDSSPGVQRYFCSTCSASVFYAVHDREGMVDVAVGLLDHPDGARAEGLLAWSYGKVGWEVDAADGWRKQLVESVKGFSKEWVTLVEENETKENEQFKAHHVTRNQPGREPAK